MNTKRIVYLLLREAGVGFALALLCIIFIFAEPKFATMLNFTNILVQISINMVLAIGLTYVILLGGIDLSVGSVLALCTIVAGKVITSETLSVGLAILLAVLASLGVGVLCGFFNGYVSNRWKLHPFIVTLGMLNIARGAAQQISNSRTIFSFPAEFNRFGSRTMGGVPIIFLISLVMILVAGFVLRKTVFGRVIYAVGNNEESARLSGHNSGFYKVIVFVISGFCVGVAAILYMLRLNIASPILGVGFELNAIAAAVIGGTSMFGGKGSLLGTFFGACIIGVLNNGLLLIGLSDNARLMVTGAIIIGAVVADYYRARVSLSLSTAA
jgi:ribose transport system permease protein